MAYYDNSNWASLANFNNVNDVLFSKESSQEPVTLEAVKNWMRVEHVQDDNLIEGLITAARIIVEHYLNMSLIKRTVTANLNNSCGNQLLPFQPLQEIVSVSDYYNNDITDSYSLTGLGYKRLAYPCEDNITLVYKAGSDCVSKPVEFGLMEQISFMYENRGDVNTDTSSIAPMAKNTLKSIKK